MIAAQLRRVASLEEFDEAVRVAEAAFGPSQNGLLNIFRESLESGRVQMWPVPGYEVVREGSGW